MNGLQYDILADYNRYYGNVEFFEEGGNVDERHYVYTHGNESWYIDAWDLEVYKNMYHHSTSRMLHRQFDRTFPGLGLRMDCHEFIRITYSGNWTVNKAPWRKDQQ